jgi:hypothetical protein
MTVKCPRCSGKGCITMPPPVKTVVNCLAILGVKSATTRQLKDVMPDRNIIARSTVNKRIKLAIKAGVVKKVANSSPAMYELVG